MYINNKQTKFSSNSLQCPHCNTKFIWQLFQICGVRMERELSYLGSGGPQNVKFHGNAFSGCLNKSLNFEVALIQLRFHASEFIYCLVQKTQVS